jgi:hypothetical protein
MQIHLIDKSRLLWRILEEKISNDKTSYKSPYYAMVLEDLQRLKSACTG